ncbi:MAG: mechanosensitive ion channel family protein [Mycoplasmatales bacterium]
MDLNIVSDLKMVNGFIENFKNASAEFIARLPWVVIAIVVMYLVTKVIILLIYKIVKNRFVNIESKRIDTIQVVLANITRYIMTFIGFIVVLVVLGVSPTALLAGAGAGAVVFGLLFKEVITDFVFGFFIVAERYFDVGDYIATSTYEGHVEQIGLRSSMLKTPSGELITLPNSKIVDVRNYSKEQYHLFYKFGVTYDTSIEEVEKKIKDEIIPFFEQNELVNKIDLLGVSELSSSGMFFRLELEVDAEERFEITRQLNRKVKLTLDQAGIQMAFNRLYIPEDQPIKK